MKVFVTGATGFIGGYFANKAVSVGHDLVCLRRYNSIPKIKVPETVKWKHGELDAILPQDLQNIDVLVHFAGAGVSPQKATWEELYYWNVMSLLRLLNAAHQAGVKRIILAGSFIEYGSSADEYDFIPPTAQLRPTTPYAASKASAFELAHGFCVTNDISLVYKRIFSAYGFGQYEKNLWPSLRSAALSGVDFPMSSGSQIRDFISVEEVVSNFVASVEMESSKDITPQVENVCSGKGVSVREFAEYWWKKWDAKGALLFGTLPSRENESKRFVGKR